MTNLPFLFVTGSAAKRAEAERILGETVEVHPLDLPEIQSLDLLEVLRAKAEEAWRCLGRPLVVEESGLDLEALGGFPGPLVKWMLEAAGAERLAETAIALGDPRATVRCALLYRPGPDPEQAVVVESALEGRLVLPPRGTGGFGWDPVFEPQSEERTLGEMSGEEKDAKAPRGRAWRELRGRLRAPGAGTGGDEN
ncbi:MAG TPA: non-canonical purine NTP pyrophosphatase [Thermoanaerobaculia bacterium]|nr:non-canonical purine NTP pyrophosphatase [Thermoanaerobaculia bacterium]